MAIPELLQRLLATPAPSGREAPALEVFRSVAAGFADVREDRLGSVLAVPRGGSGPLIALVSHVDEIGLIVTHVDDEGLLGVAAVGGWRAETIVGQRVQILTREGVVHGVVAGKSIRMEKERQPLEWTDLHVDLGARSGDEARALVLPGDVGVIDCQPSELREGVVVARAIDNRLGAYVVLEAARRVAGAGRLAAVATRREESFEAAGPAAFELEPDFAVVVDVTFATDVPGESPRIDGSHALGSGAAIGRGPALDPRLSDLLVETAEREGIPFTIEAIRRATNSDAEAFQVARAGTPTAIVSIPIRYMHTPVEVACLDDAEACIGLLVALARRFAE